MYTVQHIGHPIAGRPIQPDNWKTYSTHLTESAAWKRIAKATAHLDYGSWDDHYRVIGPDGAVCDREMYYIRTETERVLRG